MGGRLSADGGRMARPSVLLYDGGCRICSAAARLVRALSRRARLEVRPIQGSEDLLASLPAGERLGALRFVREDGRVASGGDALPALAAAVAGAPQVETLILRPPGAVSAVHRAYDALVRVRSRLTCGISPSP